MLPMRVATIAFALLIAGAMTSASADQRYYYINPTQLDLTVLLPPPPDQGSAQQSADQAQVAAAVAARSPAELSEAEEYSKRDVFLFAPAIGAGFTAARLPLTARFFGRVGSDVERLIDDAKEYWERPRPSGVTKKRASYPSGHAAFAASTAILLGELIPDKRNAVFMQAREFAQNRILLGLHYPSDVAAGWTAGTLAVFVMARNRTFAHDFAAVKAELRRADL
jgi:acid phosphatase (class A)